jgi:hypothetical protein
MIRGIIAATIAASAAGALFVPAFGHREDQDSAPVQSTVISTESMQRKIADPAYSGSRIEVKEGEGYWRNVSNSFSKILR